MILLVCARDRDLAEKHRASTLCMPRNWEWPDLLIPGTDKKDRYLWDENALLATPEGRFTNCFACWLNCMFVFNPIQVLPALFRFSQNLLIDLI